MPFTFSPPIPRSVSGPAEQADRPGGPGIADCSPQPRFGSSRREQLLHPAVRCFPKKQE